MKTPLSRSNCRPKNSSVGEGHPDFSLAFIIPYPDKCLQKVFLMYSSSFGSLYMIRPSSAYIIRFGMSTFRRAIEITRLARMGDVAQPWGSPRRYVPGVPQVVALPSRVMLISGSSRAISPNGMLLFRHNR